MNERVSVREKGRASMVFVMVKLKFNEWTVSANKIERFIRKIEK